MNTRTIVAVVLAAVAYFAIGAAWYSLFSAEWLAGIGKTAQQVQADGGGVMSFIVGFLSVLVASATLALLMRWTNTRGLVPGAKLGLCVAVGFIGAQLALNYGFEARSVALWLINTGYALIGLSVAGAIIGAFGRPTEA